jgi:hypothetical protein
MPNEFSDILLSLSGFLVMLSLSQLETYRPVQAGRHAPDQWVTDFPGAGKPSDRAICHLSTRKALQSARTGDNIKGQMETLNATVTSAKPVLPPAERSAEGKDTILVIDDDEPFRFMVSRILRHHGNHVIEAADG